MAYFETYASGQCGLPRAWGTIGGGMEIVHFELLLIGCFGVVAMADVEDVLRHIFLHHEPWSAAQAQAFALTNGVKPQPTMLPNSLVGFPLHNVARRFAKIALDVFVVIDVAEEADALAILAARVDEMFAFGHFAHFVFHEMTDGKDGFL